LFCSLLISFPGCKRRETPKPVPRISGDSNHALTDVCSLITSQEIEATQGSPIKEKKSSARSGTGFRVAQCFYTAAEFSKSVSLAVTQRDPDHQAKRSPKDFWEETFGRFDKDEKGRDRARSEKEEKESVPPKKIDGFGDDAYWASNRFGGILYVLKGDTFIAISTVGPDDEETKIKKSKVLAEKALKHL
jgi:hypothetical protein